MNMIVISSWKTEYHGQNLTPCVWSNLMKIRKDAINRVAEKGIKKKVRHKEEFGN